MQDLLREIAILNSTSATLDWDQETYAPSKAVEFRSKQMAYFAGKVHELKTSPAFQEGLEDASLGEANQRELTHQFDRCHQAPQGTGRAGFRNFNPRARPLGPRPARKTTSLSSRPISPNSSKSPGSRPITGATRTNLTTRSSQNTNGPQRPARWPGSLIPSQKISLKSPPPLSKNQPPFPPTSFTVRLRFTSK